MIDVELAAWLAARPDLAAMAPVVAAGDRTSSQPVPRVQVQTILGPRVTDLDGDGKVRTPLVQIDCWGERQRPAELLAIQVERELNDLPGVTLDGREVLSADIENEFAGPVERAPAGQSQSLGRVVIELRVALN